MILSLFAAHRPILYWEPAGKQGGSLRSVPSAVCVFSTGQKYEMVLLVIHSVIALPKQTATG